MKIELRKENRWGDIVYIIYVGDVPDHAYSKVEEAEKRFDELAENFRKCFQSIVPEVLKTIEI